MYKQRNLEIDYRGRLVWSEDKQPVLCPVSPTSGGVRLGCTDACASYEVVEHEAVSVPLPGGGGFSVIPGRSEVVCKMGGFIIGLLVQPKKEEQP